MIFMIEVKREECKNANENFRPYPTIDGFCTDTPLKNPAKFSDFFLTFFIFLCWSL